MPFYIIKSYSERYFNSGIFRLAAINLTPGHKYILCPIQGHVHMHVCGGLQGPCVAPVQDLPVVLARSERR